MVSPVVWLSDAESIARERRMALTPRPYRTWTSTWARHDQRGNRGAGEVLVDHAVCQAALLGDSVGVIRNDYPARGEA